MVHAALQKRGAEARSALVWAAGTGDAEAALALLGRGATSIPDNRLLLGPYKDFDLPSGGPGCVRLAS